MPEDDINILLRKRSALKGRVTKLTNKVINVDIDQDPTQAGGTLVLKERASKLREELEVLQNDILALCEDTDLDTHEECYDTMLLDIEAVLGKLHDMSSIATPAANTSMSSSNNQHSKIKLPPIVLQTFDGSMQLWTSFKDMFAGLVHDNNSLSLIEKFQYLKSSLVQDAAKLIQHLPLTAQNYEIAWALLCDNYSNKYSAVNYHLKNIMEVEYSPENRMYSFKHILNTLRTDLQALKSLNVVVDHWDLLIIYLIESKFDEAAYSEWSKRIDKKSLPTLANFYDYLEDMIMITERSESRVSTKKKIFTIPSSSPCLVCKKGNHKLYECIDFKKHSVKERVAIVAKHNLCFNCLSSNLHSAVKCTSKSVCKLCSKRHHSLLHQFSSQVNHAGVAEKEEEDDQYSSEDAEEIREDQEADYTTVCTQFDGNINHQVLLSTAVVSVKDDKGHDQHIRVLLDSGSQSCFISTDCVKRLKLDVQKVKPINISGIGGSNQFKVDSVCALTIHSRLERFKIPLNAVIVPKVTNKLPGISFEKINWDYLKGFKLSDPDFNVSQNIDMIIGAEYFFAILKSERVQGPDGYPSLQNSRFGWIVSGRVQAVSNPDFSCFHVNLDLSLKRFWEIEEIPAVTHLSQEERDCEEHFTKNVSRGDDGKYVVKLPFKQMSDQLGESKAKAIGRMRAVERDWKQHEGKQNLYFDFMEEYIDLGHMSKTSGTIDWQEKLPHFYLPHHAIIRETSSTSRLRVVFDGSAKSSSGLSVNDMLMVGPTQQDSIFSLLIRFRKHQVVLKADCEKMYRQIWIHPDDRKFQKIIWFNDDKKSLAEYELNTLTYGTSCAPYIAIRCLFQLASDEKHKFPRAAEVTEKDFFMDDLVTGTNSTEEAVELYQELSNMFNSAGFNLRKWSSNSGEVLAKIPQQARDAKMNLEFDEGASTTVKTLGLGWNMKSDKLYYDVIPSNRNIKLTKRIIISDIARYYDPLGLLSPVIIIAKIIIQKLWLANVHWDDEIIGDFAAKWWKFHSHLHCLNELQISRIVVPFKSFTRIELHGFCDASESGFCACLYIRVISDGNEVACNLLCAKSRVAPLKQVSLPRLELCAAVLLAKLISEVKQSWNGDFDSCYAWTDSMIVLDWLRQEPRTCKTFVANRVSQIQELCTPSIWRHVSSEENPADVASRGIQANFLPKQTNWWHGPHWLSYLDISELLEKSLMQPTDSTSYEKKKVSCSFVTQTDPKFELWNKFSNFSTILRVMAWCLRFIKNISVDKEKKQLINLLDTFEIQRAKAVLIKLVQKNEFGDDIAQIQRKGQVKNDSKIKSLSPFVDTDGILRVGGRLKNSELTNEAKHQILLPSNHKFSKLLVEHFHKKNCHAGPNLLLALIREEYWIIQGLNLTKKVFHNCLSCFRTKPNRNQPHQLMGDLPERRVKASHPFSSCGVDYAGPFLVKRIGGRHNILFKSYIALFVCFSTKAFHIEIVSDLSTMAFLAALRRFVSRRGIPSHIYSDNGTNFVGCDNNLRKFKRLLQEDNDFYAYHTIEQIKWHFIPANSPHMGGLWESGVKAVKSHLKRTIGEQSLTFEELNTITVQIEAVLNSRPLTPLSSDVNDFSALTPGHFLIGRPITSIPEPEVGSTSYVQRWKLLQQLTRDFWKRWSIEYLNTLTQRQKWTKPAENVQQGELVLLKDDNLPPTKWNMGRVVDVFPGDDSMVRVVSVKTQHGITKRAVCRIVRLPIHDDHM